MDNFLEMIEQTALQMVNVEPDDLPGLADLHTKLQSLAELASAEPGDAAEHFTTVNQAGAAAAKLVEQIILEEVADAAEALAAVGQTTQTLQKILGAIARGLNPESYEFPALLGLPSPSSSACRNETITATGIKIKLPENVDEELFGEFLSTLPYSLDSLEAAILAAEQEDSPENRQTIKGVLHNLKGESGLMGLQEMAVVCHDSETVIEEASGAPFPAEKLLAAKDWLQKAAAMLSGQEGEAPEPTTPGVCDDDASGATPGELTPADPPASSVAAPEAEAADSITIAEADVPLVNDFINESTEHLESAENDLLVIEENPQDGETLNAIFRAFHTIKGVAGFLNLKQIGSLAHVAENLLDAARKGELALSGPSIDVIFDSIDMTKQMLGRLRAAVDAGQPCAAQAGVKELIERLKTCQTGGVPAPRVGQLLVESGAVDSAEVREAVKEQRAAGSTKKVGEILVEKKAATAEQIEKALAEQKEPVEAADKPSARGEVRRAAAGDSTVKVTTGRLDQLINMVGELVIAQSMVSQDVSEQLATNQKLARNARHLDKITRDLQELAMSMRMVPVQGVFQKMARLVRDLSRKAGKQVEFVLKGAETELDRNVVEAIADPLVHMVRNSVDHGVESPEERAQTGKNPVGLVELSAYHQGGNIVIQIRDDGRGLNRDKILQKAISQGVVKEGQELSDTEVYQLIFHAGLSTAEKVTDISGRGVGMDVVRKNIESLRGRVMIESTPGAGSCFSIRLPLTLAVIDGQIVSVGSEKYVVPTISIEQSLRPTREQITTVQGGRGEMLMVRGELLPLMRLYDLFGIEPENRDPCEALVVVVADGGKRCCFQVDALLGQQQVVIKSLGTFMGSIDGISGGAIMGDGNVSLILDVPSLIKLAAGAAVAA